MLKKTFKFAIGQRVRIVARGEIGRVVARAEHADRQDHFAVLYTDRHRGVNQVWWGESSLAPVRPKRKSLLSVARMMSLQTISLSEDFQTVEPNPFNEFQEHITAQIAEAFGGRVK